MSTSTNNAKPAKKFDGWLFAGNYGAIILLVLIIIGASIYQPDAFPTWGNLVTILGSSAITAVIAVGLTIPIIAGEFDLSVGYTASLAGIMALQTMEKFHVPGFVGAIVAVLAGGIVGLVNGILVSKVKINALVATLGMGTLIFGLNYALTEGIPVLLTDPTSITWFALAQFLWLPYPVWVAIIIAVLVWIGLNRTGAGMAVKAIGGNAEAARLSGVPVDFIRIGAFVIAGLAAGLGGIMIAARTGSAAVDSGTGYLMSAFAAVFFGSAVMSAGKFHVLGTLVGVFTVGISFNIMAIAGLPTAFQFFFQGFLLILGVGVGAISRRRAARAS